MNTKPTVSARVPRGMRDALDELSRETNKDVSDFIQDAVMILLNNQDEIELDATLKKVAERNDIYISTKNELLFKELENERLSVKRREKTLPIYMDGVLADVYMSEKRDEWKSEEDIRETLQDTLEVFKERAEHDDMVKEYEVRMENPIHYAQQELKARQNDTWNEKEYDA